MRQQTLPSQKYVKPFHQHSHLLYQFILTEVLHALEIITELNKLSFEIQNRDQFIHSIIKLSGSSQHYMRLFCWNDDSILNKIKNYCAYFSQSETALGLKNDGHRMEREASQAWVLSLQMLDSLRRLSLNSSNVMKPAELLLPKLSLSIQKLARLVIGTAKRFRHDENIVYFLIRQREEINKAFGDAFIEKLLQKLFPKQDLQSIQLFLTKRYDERGFSHLIPQIEQHCAAL